MVNDDGTPKWRMAPSPYGPYWKDGMQNGYQDVGSWTFFKSTDPKRMAAAWLYAQFVTAKTVSLKKSITGLTFIRDSDIHSEFFTKNAALRRADRVLSQPGAGGLDAHRQQRARLPQAGPAVVEERRHRRDRREDAAGRHGQPGQRDGPGDGAPGAGGHGAVRAKLNAKGDPNKWLSDQQAPWKKLANEKPKGETIAYDTLLQAWKARQGALSAPLAAGRRREAAFCAHFAHRVLAKT